MMPSKIIISITIFIAVCFRYSGEVAAVRRHCHDDKTFVKLVKENNRNNDVPIMVIEDNNDHQDIIDTLEKFTFQSIIVLHVERNKCSTIKGFLRPGTQYPAVLFLLGEYMHKEVWNGSYPCDLTSFVVNAVTHRKVRSGKKTVAQIIEPLVIGDEKLRLSRERDYDGLVELFSEEGPSAKRPRTSLQIEDTQLIADVNFEEWGKTLHLATSNTSNAEGTSKTLENPKTSETREQPQSPKQS